MSNYYTPCFYRIDFVVIPSYIDLPHKKNLKAHLVRLQLPDLDEVGRSKPCGGKRPPCHLCENIKDTCTFKSKHLDEIHKINKEYNCNSKMAVYLIECQICGEQYTESTKTKKLIHRTVLTKGMSMKRFKNTCLPFIIK